MRRVYIIYSLRRIFSLFAIKIYCAVAMVVGLLMSVSVVDVLGNTAHSVNAFAYLGHAFVSTDIIVKSLLVVAFILWMWLAKDLGQSIYQNRSKLGFRLRGREAQA